jgi:hypothetical protein
MAVDGGVAHAELPQGLNQRLEVIDMALNPVP